MQLAHVPEQEDEITGPVMSPYPHIYVVGDAADAFGALKAGHTAWGQAEIAADNVVALIKSTKANKVWSFQQDVQLRNYVPPAPAITVSLGLVCLSFLLLLPRQYSNAASITLEGSHLSKAWTMRIQGPKGVLRRSQCPHNVVA